MLRALEAMAVTPNALLRPKECIVSILLCIGGDPLFAATLKESLCDDETALIVAPDVHAVPTWTRGGGPDVAIVDCASVHRALEVVVSLRHRWPVCQLSAVNVRDADEGMALLEQGADDISIMRSRLTLSRLRAHVRRARALNADFRSVFGDVALDRQRRRVWCRGREVHMSPLEYDVLLCLFNHAPQSVNKATLAGFVWGPGEEMPKNVLEVYVGYLRRKLAASTFTAITTVRGVGYRLALVDADALTHRPLIHTARAAAP